MVKSIDCQSYNPYRLTKCGLHAGLPSYIYICFWNFWYLSNMIEDCSIKRAPMILDMQSVEWSTGDETVESGDCFLTIL